MFVFPHFRTAEWISSLIDSQYCHPDVLLNVDLTPTYMAQNPAAGLYIAKSNAAKEQIRRTLFRHALFKIQNVEVTKSSCLEHRSLLSVESANGNTTHSLWDKALGVSPETTKLIAQELWTIDRCGSKRPYWVRYYKEGDDGFSTRIIPDKFLDKIAMLRFYLS